MTHPCKKNHASPSGNTMPDSVSPPSRKGKRSTNREPEFMPVDQVRQLIETVEALVSGDPISIPNPYWADYENSKSPTGFDPETRGRTTIPFERLYGFQSDEQRRAAKPSFEEKAFLKGFEGVLRFCDRELRGCGDGDIDNELLFLEVQATVIRVLEKMLDGWYALKSPGERPLLEFNPPPTELEQPELEEPTPPTIDLADADRVIRTAEWAVASAPVLENPEADGDLKSFFEHSSPGNVVCHRSLDHVQIALHSLGDQIDTDEKAAETIPDFKRKSILNGIETVLDFCRRRQSTMNMLFNAALQEAVRKTLVQLLGEWYSLEPGEGVQIG